MNKWKILGVIIVFIISLCAMAADALKDLFDNNPDGKEK